MENKRAFSLVELMLSLIIISLIAAAFTPVITKKLSAATIAIKNGASISEISDNCNQSNEDGTYSFGSDCSLCAKNACLICSITCNGGYYKDSTTCSCKKCPDGCESCENESKCTSCSTGGTSSEPGYILKNNICERCSTTNYFSDGSNCSGSCVASDGNYCDSNGKIRACAEKFPTNCATCNESKCLSCTGGSWYQDGKCTSCGDSCQHCSSATTCDSCDYAYSVLNKSTGQCVILRGQDGCGCFRGTYDSYSCFCCLAGYYLNSSSTCTLCNIENCYYCADGQSASSPKCASCKPGYYQAEDGSCKSCSSKFGDNCAKCDSNNCLLCKQGYNLQDDTTGTSSCAVESGTNFKCSDSNFMKIGNLCVTRRNMGDSTVLSIPSAAGVSVVNAKDYCDAIYDKCCWLGGNSVQSSKDCNSANNTYSGCYRTTCNWAAANAICANYKYAGKTWRLPKPNEIDLYNYSDYLSENGLQICRWDATYGAAQCSYGYIGNGYCPGTISGCQIQDVWNSNVVKGAYAWSVRCVTEMND